MRVVIQRVGEASVTVEDQVIGKIGPGYVVLIGVTHEDGYQQAEWLARKIAGLRLFEDERGRTNLSLADVNGEVMVVSQFTLYADAAQGPPPFFHRRCSSRTSGAPHCAFHRYIADRGRLGDNRHFSSPHAGGAGQ